MVYGALVTGDQYLLRNAQVVGYMFVMVIWYMVRAGTNRRLYQDSNLIKQ